MPPGLLLDLRTVGAAKVAVALATAALLLRGSWAGPGAWPRAPVRDRLLAALGFAGLACWWNLFAFQFPGFAHPSETFHYYLGAKYFPELGYTRLYECVAAADAEALDPASLRRPMRDLATNELTTTDAVLADPSRCTARFETARWSEFRHDVDFLRGLVPPRRWNSFQQDHGYNATPAWTLVGHLVTNTGPASMAQLRLLWALDPLLLLALWGAALWGFGWRLAAVAAVYFGTNYLSPYNWTGGAILRQDWLAASVLGVALLRRDRPVAGGAWIAWATLLRVFPGCLLAAVALGAAWRMVRTRSLRLRPAEIRFATGAAIVLALGFAVSSAATGGPSRWLEFAERSRVQLATPLANHVGLVTALSYDSRSRSELARNSSLEDPMAPWKEARRERFAERRPLFASIAVAFGLLLARAAAGQPLWIGAALGAALVPVALELTGYYWSLLLILAFLGERRPAIGPALCLFGISGYAASELWHWTDEIHVVVSVVGVALSFLAVWLCRPATHVVTSEE
ncbi:MAG TPA: hypothetical protein VMW19_19745 [Myxococcota bacterium]|nr:hypothetical protein [Myxococcota bacterium]